MAGTVTIGVPVYRGEAFLAETLASIAQQTYTDLEVLISLDGANDACEAICSPYLEDPRFKLTVQGQRFGWAGNISWLMAQAQGDFWYYHQQDDLVTPDYVALLVRHLDLHPEAAQAYCDMVSFGDRDNTITAPSISGATAFLREMAWLQAPYPAVGFRGLTRMEAVRHAGPIPNNAFENFACDTSWLAAVALSGELQRFQLPLYRKRYHAESTHLAWSTWGKKRALAAWSAHCVNMLEQALRSEDASVQQLRLLWLAAVERLTSPVAASHYVEDYKPTVKDKQAMFDAFIAAAKASTVHDVPAHVGTSGWDELTQWSRGFFELALAGKQAQDTRKRPVKMMGRHLSGRGPGV